MTLLRTATNYGVETLVGWELAPVPAETWTAGAPLVRELDTLPWEPATVPGTVASSRRSRGAFRWEGARQDFDEPDFWYRCSFTTPPPGAGEQLWLRFDGLATLAEVWLNGEHLLSSDNMYLAHEVEISSRLRAENQLVLRFASVAAATSVRRPRPRFRTRMVDRQQLRWVRTTFLGRMPGWSPPAAPVGPWRPVVLERRRIFSVEDCQLSSRLAGNVGEVELALQLGQGSAEVTSATLCVGEERAALSIEAGPRPRLTGKLLLASPKRWWPRPYGEPTLYAASVELQVGERTERIELESVGFRSLRVDTSAGGFELIVNDVVIRPFGACWTPPDVVSLNDAEALIASVHLARDAGMSMLRVGGTMVYENDAFYRECDRSGILVWQDFMFANCDFPADDATFAASVDREATQLLRRLVGHPCLAVLCGGSEVAQQISMLGLPRDQWYPPLFDSRLRGLCAELAPGVPYVPSSPSGGALPFQANSGVTHYYGVGAYLRPLEDARRAEVRFAAECLAFANVPEPITLEELLGDVKAPFHEPRWKERVPRDNGAGWDFDDVRDHYVRALFEVDPMLLRYQNVERALALARVAPGEVMARTLGEWRRAASTCRGALIWLFRDLWPGAGWGLVDALGRPKSVYYFVKRAIAARALIVSDEGVNGLGLELVNTRSESASAIVELTLWRGGDVKVAQGRGSVNVPAFGSARIEASTLFEHFIDLTHAYRFGPPAYEVAAARWLDPETEQPVAEAYHYPAGMSLPQHDDVGLEARLEKVGDQGTYELRLTSRRFAQAIAIDVPGYVPDDSYFNLVPAQEKRVTLTPENPGFAKPPRASIRPLNAHASVRVSG